MICYCLVSTPVTDLTITGIDNSTLRVEWGPPEMPNGYISNYTIAIVNNVTTSQNAIFNVSASVISTDIMGLCKCNLLILDYYNIMVDEEG